MRIRPQVELSAGSGDNTTCCKPKVIFTALIPHGNANRTEEKAGSPLDDQGYVTECPGVYGAGTVPHAYVNPESSGSKLPGQALVPQWCSQPSGNQMLRLRAPFRHQLSSLPGPGQGLRLP